MRQNDIKDDSIRLLNSDNIENTFNVYQDQDGRYYYNLLKNIYFPFDISPGVIQTVTPRPGELLPQLSFRVYSNVSLWWLIAKVNHIDNPLEPLDSDTTLKIIIPEVVPSIIEQIKSS